MNSVEIKRSPQLLIATLVIFNLCRDTTVNHVALPSNREDKNNSNGSKDDCYALIGGQLNRCLISLIVAAVEKGKVKLLYELEPIVAQSCHSKFSRLER